MPALFMIYPTIFEPETLVLSVSTISFGGEQLFALQYSSDRDPSSASHESLLLELCFEF